MKILKNTTLSDIELLELGVTVPASGQYEVGTSDYLILAQSNSISELTSLINSGDIIVNDGTDDLSIEDALEYIKYPDFAKAIRFDNSSNNFTSDDTQDAIEEAKFEGKDFNIVDAGVFRTSRLFSAYNSANSQVISGTPVTLQINTPFPASDNGSYLISSGEVEFLDEEEAYKINYSVTFDNSNGTRSNTQSFLEKFNGSTWSKIVASDVFTYERTTDADRQTGSTTLVVNFAKNDKLRVRSQTIQGSNNTTVAEACSITIEPAKKASGELNNFGLDCKTVNEKDDILSIWDVGEL